MAVDDDKQAPTSKVGGQAREPEPSTLVPQVREGHGVPSSVSEAFSSALMAFLQALIKQEITQGGGQPSGRTNSSVTRSPLPPTAPKPATERPGWDITAKFADDSLLVQVTQQLNVNSQAESVNDDLPSPPPLVCVVCKGKVKSRVRINPLTGTPQQEVLPYCAECSENLDVWGAALMLEDPAAPMDEGSFRTLTGGKVGDGIPRGRLRLIRDD